MKRLIKLLIPKKLKDKIRSSQQYNKIRAYKLASTSKRLDICAAQFANNFHLSNHSSISGKVCLEIGSGWVLSHAMVCYLLGAKQVIATDIFPNAYPQSLYRSIHKSIHSFPRDILASFEDHELLRKRFNDLLSIKHFNIEVLRKLGIEYIAPIDLAKDKLNGFVDFIYSNSVLEHVPCDDIIILLSNIVSMLKPGATMIHCIHLEDHKDISFNPFDFLSISSKKYTRNIQSARGNRIRKSGWLALFNSLKSIKSKVIYEWKRKDKKLPLNIDSSIDYKDIADLQISHIGIYSRKNKSVTQ